MIRSAATSYAPHAGSQRLRSWSFEWRATIGVNTCVRPVLSLRSTASIDGVFLPNAWPLPQGRVLEQCQNRIGKARAPLLAQRLLDI